MFIFWVCTERANLNDLWVRQWEVPTLPVQTCLVMLCASMIEEYLMRITTDGPIFFSESKGFAVPFWGNQSLRRYEQEDEWNEFLERTDTSKVRLLCV